MSSTERGAAAIFAMAFALLAAGCAAPLDLAPVPTTGETSTAPGETPGPTAAAPAPIEGPAPSPAERPYFTQAGTASWYGPRHHGRRTASGERFDMRVLTAAHPTLPFGTIARVTNVETGAAVTVRVNDRGPHIRGRVIDMSAEAARALGMRTEGLARVRIEAYASDQPGAPLSAAAPSVGAAKRPRP